MKVYVVVSDKDICGDIPSVLMGKPYDVRSLYNYAVLAVFEKKLAATNWRKFAGKSGKEYKIVSATLRLGGLTKG